MSPALPVVSGREAVRALKRAGFARVSPKGSHVKLRDDAGRTVIVSLHRELARGTLASISVTLGSTLTHSENSSEDAWRITPGAELVPNRLTQPDTTHHQLAAFLSRPVVDYR